MRFQAAVAARRGIPIQPTFKAVRLLVDCAENIELTMNSAGWAAASDVVLALYPVIVFWNLKISLRMKIGLCLLMAGGLVAAVGGVMKTINIKFIEAQKDKNCTSRHISQPHLSSHILTM